MTEQDRITFVEQRDGKEAALKFAEQGLALYTEAAIRLSQYKDSIIFYKEYLKKGKEKNINWCNICNHHLSVCRCSDEEETK